MLMGVPVMIFHFSVYDEIVTARISHRGVISVLIQKLHTVRGSVKTCMCCSQEGSRVHNLCNHTNYSFSEHFSRFYQETNLGAF